jgi:hypothetical protein
MQWEEKEEKENLLCTRYIYVARRVRYADHVSNYATRELAERAWREIRDKRKNSAKTKTR